LRVSQLAKQTGFSLIEVLVAGLVMGTAIIGTSLMYGTGNTWVTAMGEDRVAAGLAQQRIEQVRADTNLGWNSPAACEPPSYATVAPGRICIEPRVDPTNCDINTSECRQTPKYERVTCIQYVDPSSPAGLNTPAYAPDCPAGAASSTRRVTVTVTPVFVDGNLANNTVRRAYVVILQGWVSQSGQ
jgi:type II secretory pathway pseudopilin PulG